MKLAVGVGADGASANVAANGLKEMVNEWAKLDFLDVVPCTST